MKGLGPMLVGLSVVEQRYHAVMEVLAGIPVVEVTTRYRFPGIRAHLGQALPRRRTGRAH